MSELSIFEKSQEIRFETEIYANTCERVANVLDDINDTKANKSDVAAAIQVVVDEMTQMEQEIYGYVDAEFTEVYTQVDSKINKPIWTGYEQQYIVVSTAGSPANLRPITLDVGRVPFWSGNTFFSSPIFVNNATARVGINKSTPTEALDVGGTVRADAFRFNVTSSNSVPNKIWTDGNGLWHTNNLGVISRLAFVSDIQLYASERLIGSTSTPITGTVLLKRKTQTVVTSNINFYSVFTIALETPMPDEINEYILIFSTIGSANAPQITFPAGLRWRGKQPILTSGRIWTIVIEQSFNGTDYFIQGTAIETTT